MATSPRKLAANRANAQKSTGPTSEEGKRRSSRNAVKHGMLARTILAGTQDATAYEELLNRLRDQYQPADVIEEFLVERVAQAMWGMAKAARYESGDILRMQVTRLRAAEARDRKLTYAIALGDAVALWQTSPGVQYLLTALDNIVNALPDDAAVRNAGRLRLNDKTIQWLERYLFWSLDEINSRLKTVPLGEQLQTVRRWIVETRQELSALKLRLQRTERLQSRAKESQLALARVHEQDKIVRYDVHRERQYYRALKELEDRQRNRDHTMGPDGEGPTVVPPAA